MKIGLYSISYLGIWYAGPALSFEQFVKRAKACGYAYFIALMREIGYDGYFCYEFCHPVLSEAHEPLGLEYVDEQVKMAQEFMSKLLE
jgi:hypothetical protein